MNEESQFCFLLIERTENGKEK